jgi:hypothetical protein
LVKKKIKKDIFIYSSPSEETGGKKITLQKVDFFGWGMYW